MSLSESEVSLQYVTHVQERYHVMNRDTVEPRSNGPVTNLIPPITEVNSWSLQVNFFYFPLLAITELRL